LNSHGNQALDIVDHEAFQDLLMFQCQKNKGSDIPHSTTVTDCVLKHATLIQEELAKELQVCLRILECLQDLCHHQNAPGHVSLTFDGWTSKIMTAYLAVTGHWLTEDWKLHSELLSFSELEGSHSGENIGEELYNVLKKYGINHKVSAIADLFGTHVFRFALDTKLDLR